MSVPRHRHRFGTAFRIIMIIPSAILAASEEGSSLATNAAGSGARYAAGGLGTIVTPLAVTTVTSPHVFTKVAVRKLSGA